jgi:hypothetical protein
MPDRPLTSGAGAIRTLAIVLGGARALGAGADESDRLGAL